MNNGVHSERNRAVDNLELGTSASLWTDRQTGRMLILASTADMTTFRRRQKEGAFVSGVEFLCEITDPSIVRKIQRFNADVEVPF